MVGARSGRPRVALVSREVAPFGGGGIGPYVRSLADLLGAEFEVALFTTSRHRAAYERLRGRGDGSLPRARIVFVDEPREWDARRAYSVMHEWSARIHAALLAEYGARGPELVEFCDFLGEGCVTVQAKRTAAPGLRETAICVRAYGTAEIYDVLDGFLPGERERSFTYELERYALRYADAFVSPGGDLRGTYERFYEGAVAPPRTALHPFSWEGEAATTAVAHRDGPLRLLYLGRLERRKGVRNLVDALTGLDAGQWSLTMIGADTDTAPLGGSMRDLLALEIAGDRRIELGDPVPRAEIPGIIDSHDVVVVPSLWECWPNVALEAMQRGRPVLATPTGGMTAIVEHGRTGWLASDASTEALADGLSALIADPGLARRRIDPDRVRERFAALTDPGAVIDAYRELCASGPGGGARGAGAEPLGRAPAPAPADAEPLVSIVIPYFESERWIAEAVRSAASQTHPRTEIVIVNDGSLRGEDAILLELQERYPVAVITQPNAGLGAARNLGVEVSHGEYVLPLDADNVLAPEFVARCVAALEADREIAYVTSWLRYVDVDGRPWKGTDEGLMPIGNSSRAVDALNVGGDACAVLRRSVFDAGLRYSTDVAGFEDWALYREMRRRGLLGHAIPEPLIAYRLRDDSMMRSLTSQREEWARQAIEAHLAERALDWTAPRS